VSGRLALKILIVLAVAIGASLSGAWARQTWSESLAHSHASSAESQAGSLLAHAAAIGLLPGETAAYSARLDQLRSLQPPSASPFWAPAVPDFYERQARSYRKLARRLRATIARVTLATRTEAQAHITAMTNQIVTANQFEVDSSSARVALARESALVAKSTTPGQFRAISSALSTAGAGLSGAIAAQRRYVSGLLAQSGNNLGAVVGTARDEVAAAQGQLDLLGLLTIRAPTYRSALQQDLAAVEAAPTAFAAAVKESQLHPELAALSADYAKTLPQKMVVVSTESQSATMYEAGRQVYSTPVTTGGPELPTDHGIFHIYMKVTPWVFHSPWPPGSPYYYPPTPITYWMPFDGGEGLHDAWWRSNFGPGSDLQPTNLGDGNVILGTHGCVNMPMDAAQFVWNWAPIGTTVIVT
jgi:lipoprotein-anchoring transpeptidase ErfK/SrfK